jgi:type II secretory pathway pseudopilin PulG
VEPRPFTLSSSHKVMAIVLAIMALCGSLLLNTWSLAQYAERSTAFDSLTAAQLSSLRALGTSNRQMILLLGEANRYSITDPRRATALDEMEKMDREDRFGPRRR